MFANRFCKDICCGQLPTGLWRTWQSFCTFIRDLRTSDSFLLHVDWTVLDFHITQRKKVRMIKTTVDQLSLGQEMKMKLTAEKIEDRLRI